MNGKEMIQTALLELMCEKEFHKISIADIIRRAGINRSTYYYYYCYQVEVYDEICDRLLNQIKQINMRPKEVSSVHYADMIEEALHLFQKNCRVLKIIMSSDVESRFKDKYHDLFFIPYPNRTKSLTSEYELWLSEFFLAGNYAIMRMWILDDCKIPIKDMKIFLNTVSLKLE